jgi:glycerol kinase
MDAMVADSGVPMKEMRVDGGITANSLCMQMQADVMGIDITRPLIGETTALGAAYAAGLAVGFWSSTDEVRKQWKQSYPIEPCSVQIQHLSGIKCRPEFQMIKTLPAMPSNWLQIIDSVEG